MRDRLLLPILIPVGVIIAIVVWLVSGAKILLEIDPALATGLAAGISLAILLIAAVIAEGPRLSRQTLIAMTAIPAAAVIAVGMYIAVRPEAGGGHGEGPAVVTSFTEVATDNAFATKDISVPVNAEVSVTLENKGAALHNWKIQGVNGADGNPITTKLLQGGQSETIKFTIAQKGTFTFLCEVHPADMVGKINVVDAPATSAAPAAGAAPAGGGAAAGAMSVVATDNKFDKTAITVKANEEVTLTLDNKGSALHNLSIKNVKSKDGKDIQTQLLAGGKSETIKFIITQPGSYPFICDVHPVEMKGTLTVQ